MRDEEAGRFREVAGVSIDAAGGLRSWSTIEQSGSVDAGFILALPFDHGDLEPDCVEVSTQGGLCAR